MLKNGGCVDVEFSCQLFVRRNGETCSNCLSGWVPTPQYLLQLSRHRVNEGREFEIGVTFSLLDVVWVVDWVVVDSVRAVQGCDAAISAHGWNT